MQSSNDSLNFTINMATLENAGGGSCNKTVGRPVNVSNGNVYLQQGDYQLPGVGESIAIVRSYNSISQVAGLFGRGWSTVYDETVNNASGLLQLTMADGRVVSSITPDFFVLSISDPFGRVLNVTTNASGWWGKSVLLVSGALARPSGRAPTCIN